MDDDVARLLISCPERPGIFSAVSSFLFEHGARTLNANQHATEDAFFMRTEFHLANLQQEGPPLEHAFRAIAGRYGMDWRITYATRRKRLAIFVSRADHAL